MSTESINILLFIVFLCFVAGGFMSNKLFASSYQNKVQAQRKVMVKSTTQVQELKKTQKNGSWSVAIVITATISIFLFCGALIERSASALERKMEANENFNIIESVQQDQYAKNTYVPILEASQDASLAE